MKSLGVLKTAFNQVELVPTIVANIRDYASNRVRTFVQDDCSIDGTLEHYRALEPPFTQISTTPRNMGARGNVASLLEKCDTDYVTFSAGDDFVNIQTVRQLLDIIQNDEVDILIFKCIHSDFNDAYNLTKAENLAGRLSATSIRNGDFFSVRWKSSSEALIAAATRPGMLWSQGLVVRSALAKRAGFLPTGDVDDWGFQHNLARISLRENLKLQLVDSVLGVMSVQSGSLGFDVVSQLSRQLYVIDRYWDPQLKKMALLNCLMKKLHQFQSSEFSYHDVLCTLSVSLNKLSDGPLD